MFLFITKVCKSGCDSAASQCCSTFLENKTSLLTFIKIENKFQSIKTRSYSDHGKLDTQVVQSNLSHVTSHDNYMFSPVAKLIQIIRSQVLKSLAKIDLIFTGRL